MGLLSRAKAGWAKVEHAVVAEVVKDGPKAIKAVVDTVGVIETLPAAAAHLINPTIVPALDHYLQKVPEKLRPAIWGTTDAQMAVNLVNRPGLGNKGAGVSPERSGNKIDNLVDGPTYKKALLDQINDPNVKSIWIETYEWQDSASGVEIADALVAAKKKANAEGRPLDVRVIYDNRDSFSELQHIKRPKTSVVPPMFAAMSAVGIDVRHSDYAALRVNHRKIAVFNGKTAFIGGQNIGDNYMLPLSAGWSYHDMTQRIVGPSAYDAASVFADSWYRAGGEHLTLPPVPPPEVSGTNAAKVKIIRHSGGLDRNIERELISLIDGERKEVVLSNGFGMSDAIGDALKRAAKRGVKVTWIWGEAAHRPTLHAQEAIKGLTDAGVEVRHYPHPLHMKAAYFRSQDTSMQGSSNLDGSSTYVNDESVAQIQGGGVADDLYTRVLAPDMAISPRITGPVVFASSTKESFRERTLERLVDGDR
jgi:cardiolipin synthase